MLGLAAIASSIARQPDEGAETQTSGDPTATATAPSPADEPPAATPSPGDAEATVRFSQADAPQRRRTGLGQATTVLVEVEAPGLVSVPSLGLVQPAEPLTPARFDVLPEGPGEHEIELDPSDPAAETVAIGTLRVGAAS